ncbi:hypothetical protein [Mesorhizobium sp.]|nr:hypothetical protein [Mesorhizobium sp.]
MVGELEVPIVSAGAAAFALDREAAEAIVNAIGRIRSRLEAAEA